MSKIVKILSGTLLVLVFLFFSTSLAKQVIKPESVRLAEEQKQSLETAVSDVDKDSLPDWEEKLWGTDINNPDTDQDGVGDGEEVKLGRNPNGPDEIISPTPTKSDAPNQENLTSLPGRAETGAENLPSTSITNTPENPIHKYGNILGTLFTSLAPSTALETLAFNTVIASGTPASFDQLALIANKYGALAKAIQRTVPPQDMTSLVSELATNYNSQSQSIKNIVSFKDQGKAPVETYQAHNKNVTETAENLMNLFQFFRNQGVIFAPGEPGQIFNLPF